MEFYSVDSWAAKMVKKKDTLLVVSKDIWMAVSMANNEVVM